MCMCIALQAYNIRLECCLCSDLIDCVTKYVKTSDSVYTNDLEVMTTKRYISNTSEPSG